ncbi:MAG TPA: Na+/H+ antiporter NhaA [Chitinophagales bacterium]|nr:Na+/H+ antiporter NhaA [Chitinophagales bacterium]
MKTEQKRVDSPHYLFASMTLKQERIDVLLEPVSKFIKNETTGGIVLFVSAVVAMIWANSPFSHLYYRLWHIPLTIGLGDFVIAKDLHHWINDGLMAVFFFVVGLELKREFIGGELSSFRKALLPMAAGAGGMLVPALIFLAFNYSTPAVDGWGIPMATDIAFALGILSLLGNRIPLSLKVFLTALAIADDLGAVIVIALFYTSDVSLINIAIGAAFMAVMIGANMLGIRSSVFYGIIGIGGLWLAFLLSGVHATIAGVLAAFAIPARTKVDEQGYIVSITGLIEKFKKTPPNDNHLVTAEQLSIIEDIKRYSVAAETPLQRLEYGMHPLVALVVMPVFALANAGIEISADILSSFLNPLTLGVFLGLVLGKFIGITGMSKLMVTLQLAQLPEKTTWRHIYGVSLLGGVGFTMSLFITGLAFTEPLMVLEAKVGLMTASLIAGLGGYLLLRTAK